MIGSWRTREDPTRPVRRVREEVRDQALVMLFTLTASSLLALALTVVVR